MGLNPWLFLYFSRVEEYYKLLILIPVGVIVGFVNTVAGGGSLLSLPVMIFLGLPPGIANGTNRVALFLQNISAIAGFRSKGVYVFPYSIWVGLSAFVGAIIGAQISVSLDDDTFNRIIAMVMVGVVLITIFDRKSSEERVEDLSKRAQITGVIAFFFIGIYGGFIQAGVGFIILAALTKINKLSLVKANSVKVFVVFIYTISALAVFIIEDQINWLYGLVLAIGNVTGAWIASRWSVEKGDKWIKRFLVVMALILAIKLWFY